MIFKKNIKILSFFLFFLALSAIFAFYFYVPKNTILINKTRIKIETVKTPEKQRQGLSGREKLAKNSGMLFVFPDKKIRAFWMKNMNFPIDIVWIQDNKIVKISPNLEPEGEFPKKHYYSDVPVNYVLEVNANFCQNHNIEVGNFVKF